MKKVAIWTTLATALTLFLLAASPAQAAPGGILVDDDATCPEVDRQDNTLGAGTAATVWLNIDPTVQVENYTYELYQANILVQSGGLVFDPCPAPDDRWQFAFFTLPTALGTYNLIVYDENGVIVGGDSFRVVADPTKTSD
jgi:hypothetical protein